MYANYMNDSITEMGSETSNNNSPSAPRLGWDLGLKVNQSR